MLNVLITNHRCSHAQQHSTSWEAEPTNNGSAYFIQARTLQTFDGASNIGGFSSLLFNVAAYAC